MSELDPETDLLKLATYGMLAQFWGTLSLKEELWEDDARNILLLQKALIEEAATTLGRHLDEASLKRFRELTETFRIRMVFADDKKARRFQKK